MKIIILVKTLLVNDAIGNDVFQMHKILSNKYVVSIYTDFSNFPNLKYLKPEDKSLLKLIEDENNILIYHHSIFWDEANFILNLSKSKIIIKYHNITPAHFFKNYDLSLFNLCRKGLYQTEQLSKNKNIFWVGDSYFNLSDLNINEDKKYVLPPFNNINDWKSISHDGEILNNLLKDETIKLLFVGRIAPNKDIIFVLKVLQNYIKYYDERIKLFMIGRIHLELEKYNNEIENYINKNNLSDKIQFLYNIDDNKKLSYFKGCDFYINGSEHEGFCVPIAEAQSTGLPIISKDNSANPETIGKNQLILDNNIEKFSAAIHILNKNKNYRKFLIENGLKNYNNRFTYDIIKNQLIKIINKIGEK